MVLNDKKAKPLVAFFPIGCGLLALGLSTHRAFIGAGALFLIIGLSALVRRRKDQVPPEDKK